MPERWPRGQNIETGRPSSSSAAYPATARKAGFTEVIRRGAFTRSLAANLTERKIRVNAVAPGPVWTPLIPASFPAEHVGKFGQDTFLGRPPEPDEIAPSYIFLASSDAMCMTGQVLHPNGGEIIGG